MYGNSENRASDPFTTRLLVSFGGAAEHINPALITITAITGQTMRSFTMVYVVVGSSASKRKLITGHWYVHLFIPSAQRLSYRKTDLSIRQLSVAYSRTANPYFLPSCSIQSGTKVVGIKQEKPRNFFDRNRFTYSKGWEQIFRDGENVFCPLSWSCTRTGFKCSRNSPINITSVS